MIKEYAKTGDVVVFTREFPRWGAQYGDIGLVTRGDGTSTPQVALRSEPIMDSAYYIPDIEFEIIGTL